MTAHGSTIWRCWGLRRVFAVHALARHMPTCCMTCWRCTAAQRARGGGFRRLGRCARTRAGTRANASPLSPTAARGLTDTALCMLRVGHTANAPDSAAGLDFRWGSASRFWHFKSVVFTVAAVRVCVVAITAALETVRSLLRMSQQVDRASPNSSGCRDR
jgi:hypothetical protein